MPGSASHAFFAFFWPLSLISSRWACEVEPLETFVFYEVLGGVRVWRAGRGAGLGGSRGLSWGLWGPLGASRGPAGTPEENYRGGSGSSWETLATSGGLRRLVGLYEAASGGLWGFPGTFKASPDVLSRSLSFCSVPHAHTFFHFDVLPVPSSSRFVKGPWRSRGVPFL